MPGKKQSRDRQSRGPADLPAPSGTLSLDSIDQLKAIADPLRQRLLEQFAKRPATTKQVADLLGLKPTRLYHHVAKLERAGLIRLVETRPVRGTTEKYFAAVAGRLEIDRDAFSGGNQLAQQITGLSVIDGLFANVREELNELLADPDYKDSEIPASEQQVTFGQVEVCVDQATAAKMNHKVTAMLEEFEATAKTTPPPADARKYRLVVGWYPKANRP
jgi:DNA-binding transcriptional ArsR family regulator